MKDPLRYYLAEGMMCMYIFPDPNGTEKICGNFNTIDAIRKNVLVVNFGDKRCIMIDRVIYPVSNEFFLNYGTHCQSETDALVKCVQWEEATKACTVYFEGISGHLAS